LAVRGPVVIHPERKTSATASISESSKFGGASGKKVSLT
jgi:hypothetical protein